MLDRQLRRGRRSAALLALGLLACGGTLPAHSPGAAAEGALEAPALGGAETRAEEASPTASRNAAPDPAAKAPGEPAAMAAPAVGDFKRLDTHTAKATQGVTATKLKATNTLALLKFVVIDRGEGTPIEGVVVSLTGGEGTKYYTEPTDAVGYADVLVPSGQKYEVVYLSLKGKDIAAQLEVEDKQRLTLKLTLRYESTASGTGAPLILQGIQFDTGKVSIRPESFPRLDSVAEYMLHKKAARLEISGHTDSVGDEHENKALSKKRAEACRDYLVAKGVSGNRLATVGYGAERPIAPNSTPEGRQKNRRIEAVEL